MHGYIKSSKDFKTLLRVDIEGIDATYDSIYDEVSKFDLAQEIADYYDDYFIFDSKIWVINDIERDLGKTKIKCADINQKFSRDLPYPGSGTYIESFIETTFNNNYKNVADAVYALPYLIVSTDSETSFIEPEVENNLFNLKSYIARARRTKSVFTNFSVSGNNLLINIGVKSVPTYKIDFKQSDYFLESESYSNKSVSKITAVQGTTVQDYYLKTDGSISTDPNTGIRAPGQWITKSINDNSVMLDDVTDEFAKNSHSHSVIFMSRKRFNIYDKVLMNIRGKVVSSYIAAIRRVKNDNRLEYKTGELQDTITEKMNGVI